MCFDGRAVGLVCLLENQSRNANSRQDGAHVGVDRHSQVRGRGPRADAQAKNSRERHALVGVEAGRAGGDDLEERIRPAPLDVVDPAQRR